MNYPPTPDQKVRTNPLQFVLKYNNLTTQTGEELMSRTFKLALFVSIIAITALACSFGADDSGTDTGSGANILFEDDFSNPNSGWDSFEDADGATDYDNGTYRISLYTDTMFYWANPYKDFDDVAIEVQAQKTSGGDDMQYGVICRHKDVNNWYALVITGDGYATIRKRYNGGELEYITDWVQVSAINTGNSGNSLRAECIGNKLTLFVNGAEAISVIDGDITSGDAGLMAGTFDQPNTEVRFDNFVVMKP